MLSEEEAAEVRERILDKLAKKRKLEKGRAEDSAGGESQQC